MTWQIFLMGRGDHGHAGLQEQKEVHWLEAEGQSPVIDFAVGEIVDAGPGGSEPDGSLAGPGSKKSRGPA
jgi:hypothetical protein